ncbi:hypothetical protein R1flu_006316 [Riccia fluitans]|uniref:Uncharacterized protein n=1 Tax=Riccia fluitans TaxID=41844 RepID=A0ABD1YZQ9_9MARC
MGAKRHHQWQRTVRVHWQSVKKRQNMWLLLRPHWQRLCQWRQRTAKAGVAKDSSPMEAKTCQSQRSYVVKTLPSLVTFSPVKAKQGRWGQTRGKPFAMDGECSPPLAKLLPMEANRRLGLCLESPAFASIGEAFASGGETLARASPRIAGEGG